MLLRQRSHKWEATCTVRCPPALGKHPQFSVLMRENLEVVTVLIIEPLLFLSEFTR